MLCPFVVPLLNDKKRRESIFNIYEVKTVKVMNVTKYKNPYSIFFEKLYGRELKQIRKTVTLVTE
mgnify:CR=1 FL=1